ncbi:hypothetical protein [Candidatus Nitrospira neomarina]|uniref:Metallo-beta-lactamase domain-containing protein n=1 Tax=Candidatus Nitrospira neomarina TaxID=3020899 RepID=A0AA96GLB5_9BACT|nr:hypothetical protein [Candidatus Nitrospira neomarina]WNM62500.1 hypothetical protein PQG83_01780 [Candidatus Nitrospira neomarina]
MDELLPGIFHWRVVHPDIQIEVDSYYVSCLNPTFLIDPLVPQEGTDWFRERPAPQHIYLTNRLHDRHCRQFIKNFGVMVWCHEAGLQEFTDGNLAVTAFRFGDELPGGVRALKIGILCPEETALLLPSAGGVLSIGDAIINEDGELGFVPDTLIGDNPSAVKRGLKAAFLRICQEETFDHLLFAHGNPIIGGGKDTLRTFCQR